jgi:hypothetical protein
VRRLVYALGAGGALWVVFAAWYAYEDPFLRRWPSPRERAAADRLKAMHDAYETQPWVSG